MTPIESMARAIYATQGRPEPWERIYSGNQEGWLEMARAALVGLRDCGVTEGMVQRAAGLCGGTVKDRAVEFRAMLDAALQEDSGSNGRPG